MADEFPGKLSRTRVVNHIGVTHRAMVQYMPTPVMTLRLPAEDARALTELAATRGMTRTDLIREMVREVLGGDQAPTEAPAA